MAAEQMLLLIHGLGATGRVWDGWEKSHGATRSTSASLVGFHRDFNKASTSNWGSSRDRGPTLGLTPGATAKCEGMAFEFPDAARDRLVVMYQDVVP